MHVLVAYSERLLNKDVLYFSAWLRSFSRHKEHSRTDITYGNVFNIIT